MFGDLGYDLNSAQETPYDLLMESVYQNTFWFVVALLAVLLPLYVLAVSLLGRAIGIARGLKRKIAAEQANRAKAETEEAARELQNGDTKAARDRLNSAEKEEKQATKELKQVDKRYNLLSLRCCVIIPGALLLTAAVLSAVAESLASDATNLGALSWIALFSWVLSLLFIALAASRLIRALSVVQEVSLASEETALRRTTEALKTALSELEDEKRPELDLMWWDPVPPIHVSSSGEFQVKYGLVLTKAEVARSVLESLFVPPGFELPGEKPLIQEIDAQEVAGYKTAERRASTCLAGSRWLVAFRVKAAEEPGTYTLYNRLCCEGFQGELVPFEVVVEDKSTESSNETAIR